MHFDPLNDGVSAVQYIDHMGDDLRVVNAARVSLDWESQFECDETGRWLQEKDEQLIAYLAKHHHISPFFHPQICLRISMPLYLGKLWWRSTVGVSRSEIFQRYVRSRPQLYSPADWGEHGAAPPAAGAAPGPGQPAEGFAHKVEQFYRQAETLFEDAMQSAIPAEMAHMVLPQSMYTSWMETGSLYYFSRMFALHQGQDFQGSLAAYVDCVDKIARGLFPVSWRALSACRRNAQDAAGADGPGV